MKTKQQLREHLHTYAQIGVAVGLLMGAIDLWGEDLQAQESALLDQVLSEELTAYEIFESLSTTVGEVSGNATSAPDKTSKSAQAQPSVRPSTLSGVNLAKLQSQNSEFIAWLQIPGTKISYPVVQTDDAAYYLTHTFSRKEGVSGCLFSLGKSDYSTPSRNIAVYGHHMRRSRSTTMFQPLHEYKSASFRNAHADITFDTLYGSRSYTVFAVINKRESDWDASAADFASDADYQAFLDRVQDWSLYDTGVHVSTDDHILTLITCDRDYHSDDGQLVVMAVQN